MSDDAYSIFIDFLIPWEVGCQGWDAFERILCEIKPTEYNAKKGGTHYGNVQLRQFSGSY